MKQFIQFSLLTLVFVVLVNPVFSQTITHQVSSTVNHIEAVWFTDALNGWAVGNSGTILMTTNGGESWSSKNLTTQDLKDVAFLDSQVGLIVGDDGRIYRTTDGGSNWSQISSGTESNILAVAFGEGRMAYAAGRDGVLLRSTDNGASWSVVATGSERFRGLSARGTQLAWAVGNEGAYKMTTDGGLTWNDKSSGTTSDLHDVFFLNASEGWVAGQNDLLNYSGDSGDSWNSRNSGINVGIEAVFFLDSYLGWAVGNTGRVFKSINGGANWLNIPSGVTSELNDAFFVSSSKGWIVGENGAILLYEDETNPTVILQLANMTPHLGQKFEARLVDKSTNQEAGRQTIESVPSADFSVTFSNLSSGASYWIDFYADHNQNGVYNAPPTDHAWRLEANNITGERVVNYSHNMDFVDIQWPGSTVVPGDKRIAERVNGFRLERNYPNPFNPETVIQFTLPQSVQVRLAVFNMLGQQVRSLIAEDLSAGVHAVKWDGRDEFGQTLTSGVYFYRIDAGNFSETQRMILAK